MTTIQYKLNNEVKLFYIPFFGKFENVSNDTIITYRFLILIQLQLLY